MESSSMFRIEITSKHPAGHILDLPRATVLAAETNSLVWIPCNILAPGVSSEPFYMPRSCRGSKYTRLFLDSRAPRPIIIILGLVPAMISPACGEFAIWSD
jgi:hypothetical protein